jgi:hypothetical protein
LRGAAGHANADADSHSYCNSDINADANGYGYSNAMHGEMCTNTEAASHSAPSAMTLIPK